MKTFGDSGTTALDVLRQHCSKCGQYSQHKAVSAGYNKPEVRRLEDKRLKEGSIRYILRPRRCGAKIGDGDEECGDRTVPTMYTVELKEKDFQELLSLIPEDPKQT